MRIGCPRERKDDEFRVALIPSHVRALVSLGHTIVVERGAGLGSGFEDAQYAAAGAILSDGLEDVYGSDLVIKVKEPVPEEYPYLRKETLLFAFLHLAAAPELAHVLLRQKVTAIAFETITGPGGTLPLLIPMSTVAGRLAVQAGATALQRDRGGKGVLLSGVPGVPPAHVVILGAGTVGRSALQMAVGLGARVTVIDVSSAALREVDGRYAGRVETLLVTPETGAVSEGVFARRVVSADLLIGAVLVPGARAPKLVSRALLRQMEPGSVVVDVSVDQGGCFETTQPTTHHAPTYVEEGVIHYAVANMPSIVARTSTLGLAAVTFPVLKKLVATNAVLSTLRADADLRNGLTTFDGAIVRPEVAASLGLPLGPSPL